jgi:histidyl-tRNA synthetase
LNLDLSLPRGIRDVEPEEYELQERIISSFIENARLFGFKIMEPATIEKEAILTAKSGHDILNELYSFEDKAGRKIGLRFDLTVGITRYVCSRKDIPLPQKLASYGYVWRYDEPQHARYRSFKQWDVEIFDRNTVDSDAEVIEFTYRLLKGLGINFSVEIGHRFIPEEFARKNLGIGEYLIGDVLRMLDKTQKKSREEIFDEYLKKGFSTESIDKVLSLSSMKGNPETILESLSSMGIDVKELSSLCDMLRARGVDSFNLNMGIVRGLDYYTGIVFEAFDKKRMDLGAICGGGRYDILPKVFGRNDISATGVAGGIERISLSISGTKEKYQKLVVITFANQEVYSNALRIMKELRDNGIPSETAPMNLTLRKQVEFSSSSGARWVVITGPKDIQQGLVTLRDMHTGEETKVRINELTSRLRLLFSKS